MMTEPKDPAQRQRCEEAMIAIQDALGGGQFALDEVIGMLATVLACVLFDVAAPRQREQLLGEAIALIRTHWASGHRHIAWREQES